MSGDVQPRKRKDKKRRKDELEEQKPSPPTFIPPPTDDQTIHVHKEEGTGGGICAKIVFFILFSALIVLIGLIITEHRGLTDLDTIDTESRFSQLFEGWVDSSIDSHDHDPHLPDHEEDDHDEEHELESEEANEEHEEEEDDEDATEEDDHTVESEENDLEEDDKTVEESEEQEYDSRVSYETQEEQDDEDNSKLEEDEDEADKDDDEDERTVEKEDDNTEDTVEDDESDDNTLEEKGDDDDQNEEEEDSKALSEEGDAEEGKSDDTEDSDKTEEVVEDLQDNESGEKQGADLDRSAEVGEEAKADEVEEVPSETSGSSMAVKVGVGVALLIVAHVVLVRKWRSASPINSPKDDDFKEPTPDLSRRNTLIPPPPLQEVEQDIDVDEEEYSDEEGDFSDEKHEEYSAKTKYQELRSTYSRSLTPESDNEYISRHEEPLDYEEYEEEEEEYAGEEEESEEDIDSEEVEDDDDYDEDEELLQRLEAKYGKLHQDVKDEAVGEGYEESNISNEEDRKIKDQIDEAHKSIPNNAVYAIKLFDNLLEQYPTSPRSLYGKALALDELADQRKSNEILKQSLTAYLELLNTEGVPDELFRTAAERCIQRMRFIGQYQKAISVHKALIRRFPNEPKYQNELAVSYLTVNLIEEARDVLKKVLQKWPSNGFALVHLGFILKTADNKLDEAAEILQKGLDTNQEGVIDGRFYFHLGDALTRLGRTHEANKVYEEGVKNKVFLSKYQRSLYNVDRLLGKPWWEKEDIKLNLLQDLEDNWQTIRDEGLAVLNHQGYFQDEAENLRDKGEWKQFELFVRGRKNVNNCKRCPITCKIIENNPEARNCRRGQTKFSVMHPGTHVWPHCGPTNCRLRVHLGLKVPQGTFLRVAEETRSWREGKVMVFDDSFEHEVWHNGTEFRLVLIVDIWHPDLTTSEKRSLSPI